MSNITLILISVLFSAFFSGMEIAFVSSNKVRLELDLKRRSMTGFILRTFYRNRENFISTLLVGNNIALVVYGIAMAKALEPTIQQLWNNPIFVVLTQTLLSTLIILTTAEFLPKTLFRVNPNASLRICSLPLLVIYVVLYPISIFTTFVSKTLLRIFGIELEAHAESSSMSKVDLDYFIQQSIDDPRNSAEVETDVKMFQNALDFSNVRLRDCMVPRTEIVAIDIDHTELEDLIRQFTETGLSKLLVYKENIDNIIGYIHSVEMFAHAQAWRDNLKPIKIVPETLSAQKLMKSLMVSKMSLAVVVDEFGGTAGIVTLEDLVEEIFGEIEDEHDLSNYIVRQKESGEYELSGRLEIEQLNETFQINFPESDDYMTVAGYILFHYQRVPKEGEEMLLGGYHFKIVKMNGSKIELVEMKIEK